MSRTRIAWFARGGGIVKKGPYPSQLEASNALRRKPPEPGGFAWADAFPSDAFVWPEEIEMLADESE